ncbi:MAG: hypothetical protein Q8O34_00890 [Rhodocyclaceae bacterium]|nr:hypothetical protein [Rhodocyclaceae bacterium]
MKENLIFWQFKSMFINKAFASIGEREGLGTSECVGKNCAVATFTEIGLAIAVLIMLVIILWVFEILYNKWNNRCTKNNQNIQKQPTESKKLLALIKTEGKSKEQIKDELKRVLEKKI